MTEVILNDECMHCNDRECHDGEHFCNYAMTDNSFYKNAKMYKGLEVIQRPTYEELEKENAELKHTIATLRQKKDNVSMHAKAMEVVAKTRSDQFTKAKTYLKYFIEILKKLGANKEPLVIEAEQFIKENKQNDRIRKTSRNITLRKILEVPKKTSLVLGYFTSTIKNILLQPKT